MGGDYTSWGWPIKAKRPIRLDLNLSFSIVEAGFGNRQLLQGLFRRS
jgi:hypothetical protein